MFSDLNINDFEIQFDIFVMKYRKKDVQDVRDQSISNGPLDYIRQILLETVVI